MQYYEQEGISIPRLGYGTWQMTGRTARDAVGDALALGYRHIDTAQAYENHAEIGAAIAGSGIPRDHIFLTSKVWLDNFEPQAFRDSLERTLEELGTPYVDLLLLHWPHPERPLGETLNVLAEAKEKGRARLVGVSNFTTQLLDEAVPRSPVPLATNQVEYHPFLDQQAVRGRVRRYDMTLTAYAPLSRGEVTDDPVLQDIAAVHGKSPGQVALRWLLQQPKVLAIPKAEDPAHARDNLDVFDFELSRSEMARLYGLSRPDGRRIDPDWAPAWDEAS